MSDNMNKMLELMKTNPELQKKAETALNSMSDQTSAETLLNDILGPIAKELGIELTMDDLTAFADHVTDTVSLSLDDMAEVNGGFLYGLIPLVGKVVQGINSKLNSAKGKLGNSAAPKKTDRRI